MYKLKWIVLENSKSSPMMLCESFFEPVSEFSGRILFICAE